MIVLAGIPLRLRARLTAAVDGVEVARTEAELFAALSRHPRALVLQEGLGPSSLLELLSEVRRLFAGPLLLILCGSHPPRELKALLGSGRSTQIFHHPAAPEDLLRSLALEAGSVQCHSSEPPLLESLTQLWHESLPLFREWLSRLESALEPEEQGFEEARQAAHYLMGNLGTFGLPQATLLAREAERILQQACAGGDFPRARLEQVIGALRQLSQQAHPYRARRPRAVLVLEQSRLLEDIDLEARLLEWEVEVCDDLGQLAEKLAHESTRVVVVEAQAATCRQHPELLAELLQDSYPKVVLVPFEQDGGVPVSLPSCRYLGMPSSGYQVMMAVLRSQLTPSLDNPPYILVVDDDRIAGSVIEHALSQVDFYVESLDSPIKLWEKLEESRPDLILLDIELPQISGIELCRALRMDDRYCSIPVMFVSSYADSRTVQRAYEAGADDYLFKPVVPQELRVRVSNRLERCQHLRRVPGFARAYGSLHQLLLRSARKELPLAVAVIAPGVAPHDLDPFLRQLRSQLRGEDLVKFLTPTDILVVALSADQGGLERRLAEHVGQRPWGLAWRPQDGGEFEALVEVARSRIACRSVAGAGQLDDHEGSRLDTAARARRRGPARGAPGGFASADEP